jgi:CSLREA domain-containing protein
MMSISQGQRIRHFSQWSKKNNASGVFIAVALLGVFLSASARAAVFTVNSTSDVVGAAPLTDGICATAYKNGVPNGVCTLRAAIMEANHTPGGPHTISIPPGLYALTIFPVTGADDETNGDLNINAGMSIVGAGSSTTIIDANHNINVGRVFRIGTATVSISGVTIRNGFPGFGSVGGGISNGGTLTLTNSTVSGNSAAFGGGISNSGTLTLTNSTVSGNNAGEEGGIGAAEGGGILNFSGGTVILTNSTVSGNKALSNSHGGGIYNGGGTLTLTNSTVSGNSAEFDGGGIFNNGGTLTLTNSTVSGNSAEFDGGGILHSGFFPGNVTIFSSTITGNTSGVGTGLGFGGGIAIVNIGSSVVSFQNTILAGNQDEMTILGHTFFQNDDCSGTIFSNGHNLMGVNNCMVSDPALIIADPQLGPLQNNGGPTQTHALLAGSPAIDAGDPGGCQDSLGALLTTDQRGFPRPKAGCDIGAYESFTGANTSVVAALLPSSRSVQVGTPATAFATMINTGQGIAAGCNIAPITAVPASFVYQTTTPATNKITGFPNTPVNIGAGALQSFVFAFTPTVSFPPTDVQMSFDCVNSTPAPVNTGLNTLLLSASNTPVPDIVALAATLTNDGIVNIPGTNGTGAFAVATVNVGASGSITASADTGSASLPAVINLCETNSATGQCISAIAPGVTTTINAGATPTFGIFVQGNGTVPFDPAVNRTFVRFKDAGGVTRGSTSVAVRTQ